MFLKYMKSPEHPLTEHGQRKILAASVMRSEFTCDWHVNCPHATGYCQRVQRSLCQLGHNCTQRLGGPIIIILFPPGVCSAHVPISRVQFLSGLVKASQIRNQRCLSEQGWLSALLKFLPLHVSHTYHHPPARSSVPWRQGPCLLFHPFSKY